MTITHKIHKISLGVAALFLLPLAWSCSKTDDNTIESQRNQMVTNYINKFAPKNNNGDPDYTFREGVYVIIDNKSRADYDYAKTIERGDSVLFWFSAYVFSSNLPDLVSPTTEFNAVPVLSNEEVMFNQFAGTEGFASYWPRKIERAKHGSSPMIKGLERGLKQCREGDTAVVLITADLAYGNKSVANIPEDAAMAFRLIVEKVKKK